MEKREAPGYPGKGRRIRQWSSIAIVMLIAGIVVGSWTVISRMANKQPVTGGKNVATPQNTNKYVYIGYKDVVYKLSERDGSIVWQHALKQPHKPYRLIGSSLQVRVENDIVYATVEYAVYALSSSNGKELWHYFPTPTKEQLQRGIGSVMDLFIDRSLAYVYSPDGRIAALDAHSGIQKWRRMLLPNGGPISAVDGILYLQESGPQGSHILHAIDGATGVERWRFESPIWGNAGFTPASVVNGIAYSSGNPLTALDERTGKKLWEQRLPDRSMYFDNFHIINGILYSSTSAPSAQVGGQEEPLDHYLVFAFDAKTG
ncbi:MAG: PQQ-like beta-propeller repeat protein, partial [Ktedonobacteraceae bacterium]|nr:PQQ-like beta-propeller repeat protein [Ktedonobacteraceae bacterium]